MYVQLLKSALAELPLTGGDMNTRDAVAELVRLRGNLRTGVTSGAGPFWAPDAVANELAYDIALIRLARVLGISCKFADFDRPAKGRSQLELDLVSRGIRLDDPDRCNTTLATRGTTASGA